MPLELTLKGRRRRGQRKESQEQRGKKEKEIEVIIWNKEAVKKYKERTDALYGNERAVRKGTDRGEIEKNQMDSTRGNGKKKDKDKE